MKSNHFRVAALAAAGICALSTAALASHAWSTYHWKTNTSGVVVAPVVSAVSSNWQSHLNKAVADWNASSVIESPGPTAAAGVNPKTCKAQAGKILVCNARYGQNGWLGIASIWLSDGHISQGTTKVNDTYFNMSRYNTPSWRAAVMCQEIGHDYGLGHQDEDFNNPDLVSGGKESCMDYTADPVGNEQPNLHDYDQLEAIYNHSNHVASTSFATVRPGGGAASAGGPLNGAEPGDGPAQWGRAIATDAHGRPNIYELDLGGGNKKITHVLWAIGEGPQGGHRD